MSELILRVTAPPGAGSGAPVVQRTFSVGGTLTVQLSPRAGPVIRLSARVRFGDGGPLVDASFSGSNWQCSGAPPASVPALVAAHRLYGDAGRDAEIVGRNRIRHPGRVPGGHQAARHPEPDQVASGSSLRSTPGTG
mgnify:CR=1 FL=1